MPSNDGLISHLACLVYLPYLEKLHDRENCKIRKISGNKGASFWEWTKLIAVYVSEIFQLF